MPSKKTTNAFKAHLSSNAVHIESLLRRKIKVFLLFSPFFPSIYPTHPSLALAFSYKRLLLLSPVCGVCVCLSETTAVSFLAARARDEGKKRQLVRQLARSVGRSVASSSLPQLGDLAAENSPFLLLPFFLFSAAISYQIIMTTIKMAHACLSHGLENRFLVGEREEKKVTFINNTTVSSRRFHILFNLQQP